MTSQEPGKSATWAKALAAIVLLILLPIMLWILFSVPKSTTIPW
ncbi:hypothetical protein [Streptomyces sp. cg35]